MPVPIYPTSFNLPSFSIKNEDRVELNLNNPIFVAYVDVKNLSKQSVEESLHVTKKMLDVYKNITFWVIASDETRIECVYDGQCRTRDMEISDLVKEINTRIDIMSKSNSFEDFKINIRDWRINELVNGNQQE